MTKSRAALAVLLAVLGSARAAHAAEPPPEADARARATEEDRMVEARKHFHAGVNLLEDPDGAKYEEAYGAFQKAYELSQSPKVLGNLALCAMHLERDSEAIDAYTTYLRDAPDVSERERAQIQRDLATMTSTIARLRVVVPGQKAGLALVLVDTRVQTRGANVQNTYKLSAPDTTVRLRPGRHVLTVKAGAEESLPFEVSIEPASLASHEFTFAPPAAVNVSTSTYPRAPSLAGPVFVGITGLLAVGAGVATGTVAQSKTSDIEAKCPGNVCPASYDLDAQRSRARTFGTIADVSLIGGGTLVAGAILWFALLPRRGSAPEPSSRTAWRGDAACTTTACSFQLQRGF